MEQTQAQLPATQESAAPPVAGGTLSVLRALGAGRLAALGLTAVALLGLFALLVLRVAEPSYTVLYAGLEVEDSAAIVERLEALEVPYRLGRDGASVLVPAERAARLRLSLAEEGLPQGGSVGYEVFDETGALGTTSFLADINHKRALEGELARTITSLGRVRAARVHLVLPKRELFRRDRVEPSASVTLRMGGGNRLGSRQVQAIRHLVAAAVPDLAPDRVTLVDDQGTLLARSGGEGEDAALPGQAEEIRRALEGRLKQTVEDLLERSLGAGRVRAEVRADMDFDRVSTTEETFDPEGRVVRSTQTVEEESEIAERDEDDAVTVGNNLPNAGAEDAGGGRTSSEVNSRSEETVNYEISRTVRNHTQAGGRVRRLSVAVLVDGRLRPNAEGQLVREPLEPAEIEKIATLVRSAVGYDAERGDVVEIIDMPFTEPPVVEVEDPWLDLGSPALMRLAELLILAALIVLLVVLVVRPTLSRILPVLQPAHATAGAAAGLDEEAESQALLTDGAEGEAAAERRPALSGPKEDAERVDVENVAGSVRADLVNRAFEAVDNTPDDVIAIIRNWLHEK